MRAPSKRIVERQTTAGPRRSGSDFDRGFRLLQPATRSPPSLMPQQNSTDDWSRRRTKSGRVRIASGVTHSLICITRWKRPNQGSLRLLKFDNFHSRRASKLPLPLIERHKLAHRQLQRAAHVQDIQCARPEPRAVRAAQFTRPV